LGLVRLLLARGEKDAALAQLGELAVSYPDNIGVKKELARNYAARKDWARAESLAGEILQRNSRDGEFILLKALCAIEQKKYQDAQPPLDAYASIDSANRDYLFLRARLQYESYRNRDSALNYLRSITRAAPEDTEALSYMAGLLIESPRSEEAAEGRAILSKLLSGDPSADALLLAVKDAAKREDWQAGRGYVARLLAKRREGRDLLAAFQIEQGLGNAVAELSYARELYGMNPQNDDYAASYAAALIDSGRPAEAGSVIAERLSAAPQKSRWYYLRSRLSSGDAALADLRSALFEDPRSLDAIMGMFDAYRRRGDDRRAVYYLKQALAIDPASPRLKRWELEYRSLL
jgi:thioredoxin-like negative regulator of GroEL